MSDSEDSDSFLSADEGGDGDANESSDITLSSDSEPEEGGKAATGGQDSSDITLSSDEDESGKQPAKEVPQGSAAAGAAIKNVEVRKDSSQREETTGKVIASTDNEQKIEQRRCPTAEQKTDGKLLNMSEVSSTLSPSTSLKTKDQLSAQSATPANQTPNTDSPLKPKEVTLKTTAPCSNSSAIPVEEAQASQTPLSVDDAPVSGPTTDTKGRGALNDAPVSYPTTDTKGRGALDDTPVSDPTTDTKGRGALDDAPPVAQHAPDAEGWGDLGDGVVLPEDDTETPVCEGEPADWGWTDDQVPATNTANTTQSAPPAQAGEPPPPSEPVSPPPPTAASAPASSPAEQAKPPESAEQAAPPPERRRPERRERRGPLKLGAKKLGARQAPAPSEPSASDRDTPAAVGAEPAVRDGGAAVTAGTAAAQPIAADASQQDGDQDGWGSWENWGTSLISSAVDATKVVLETVETGFGAPDPEDLARITKEEREQERQKQEQERQETQAQTAAAGAASDADAGVGLGSWFGGVSRVLGQTSSLVVNTGLDTLEAIGKKTMHVLQDDQLGIHDTISQLSGQKPSLSQTLREARERRGDAVPCSPGAGRADRGVTHPPTFSHLFDQCDGTVHLEALEMLSSRCQSRVTSAKSRVDEAAGIVLDMIEELCSPEELEEVEPSDFEAELSSLVSRLSVPIKPTRLIIAQCSAVQWLESRPAEEPAPPGEVLGRSVRAAAEVGAGLAEFLHKLAELQLVEGARDPVSAGRHLARLAALVAAEAGRLAARFAETLSGQRDERAAAATTDIYLEVSYLQKFCNDALHLMSPVLQMAALNDKS